MMTADDGAVVISIVLAAVGLCFVSLGPWYARNHRADVGISKVPRAAELKGDRTLKVQTWAESSERTAFQARRILIYASAAGGASMLVAGVLLLNAFRSRAAQPDYRDATHYSHLSGIILIVIGALVMAYSCMPYFASRSAYRQRRYASASALVDEALAEACSGDLPNSLLLPKLFQLNRRQLDEYQALTRKQQKSAYVLAQVASIVAFLVLVGGIVTAIAVHDDIDKYISGGLSGLGAALSAFLAKTFFESHRDANDQMNRYYLEPQRTGRLLAAERIISQVQEAAGVPLLPEIVKTVLSWEMPKEAPRKRATSPHKTTAVNGSMPAAPAPKAAAPA
jgi:uncharacterized membrane protein YidH (DUF202 family)